MAVPPRPMQLMLTPKAALSEPAPAVFLAALIRPAIFRIDEGSIAIRHFRRMLPVAGIAYWTWNSSTATMARFGRVARAVTWLVQVILADPPSARADRAFGIHVFIVTPAVFPAFLNTDPTSRLLQTTPFRSLPQSMPASLYPATMRASRTSQLTDFPWP
jgi:hypothetical protein